MAKSTGRSTISLIHRPIQVIGRVIDDITAGLKSLAGGPLREMKSLSRTFAREEKRNSAGSYLLRLPWLVLLSLLSVVLRILFSPIELLAGISRGRMGQSLLTSPWLIALILVAIGCYVTVWRKPAEGGSQQLAAARQAFHEKAYGEAVELYEPLVSVTGEMEPMDRLHYALALMEVERKSESVALLQQLAPGPGKTGGFAPAHRLRAIQIAAQLEQGTNGELLTLLSHHLEQGGPSNATPDYSLAQAEYRIAIGHAQEAIPYLRAAASFDPKIMVKVADIEGQLGNEEARQAALNEAALFFANLVTECPQDSRHRLMYARILFDQHKYLQAEQVLAEGLERDPSPIMKRSVADFFYRRFQMSSDRSFAERFTLIQKSLNADLNFVGSYEALLLLYRQAENEAARSEIMNYLGSELHRAAATTAESALVDFTLSNIYWMHGAMEQSRFAMESAFRKNREFAVVANNLAWLLAEAENPDLDRAAELARAVVTEHPNNGHFRDTLGTVLMKQQQYDLALAEFQKALPSIKTTGLVHQKMAEIYRRLGKPALAAEHDRKANPGSGAAPPARRWNG